MVSLIRTNWSGTTGGPGLTQIAMNVIGTEQSWQVTDTEPAVEQMRLFWNAIRTFLPDELTLTVSPVVDFYDDRNGQLVGSDSVAVPPAPIIGGATGSYAGGAGFKINWNTNQIANGRRVRGHTYVVPAAATVFTNTGSVSGATITAVNTAAAAMISNLANVGIELRVWSRPRVLPTPREGTSTPVVSGACAPKSAILRGRRD